MRLWTLHPRYLDAKGLVAAWHEALLAQKVLQGATRGYRNHPQLTRFKAHPDPVAALAEFLRGLATEAKSRAYHFDSTKISTSQTRRKIPVTTGQMTYEWEHLHRKLLTRDPARHRELASITSPEPHPLFRVVSGEIEPWEVTAPPSHPPSQSKP